MYRVRHCSLLFLPRRKRKNRPHARVARTRLDRNVFARAAFEWTNATLLRIRDEVDKLAPRVADLHIGGLLDRLANIQTARVNQFERRLYFIPVFGVESGASQPDHIQTENVIAFGGDHERRNVFAERGRALRDGQSADVHVLVKNAAATEKGRIANSNVPAEQTIVRDDHIVSDLAVVSDMRTGHQKVFVPNLGDASFGAAAMNC